MEAVVFLLSKLEMVDWHPWKMLTNSGKRWERREEKIKRSFAGMSERREDGGEGAWHCVCMIGCDGSEAFTRIYECLF